MKVGTSGKADMRSSIQVAIPRIRPAFAELNKPKKNAAGKHLLCIVEVLQHLFRMEGNCCRQSGCLFCRVPSIGGPWQDKGFVGAQGQETSNDLFP